MKSKKTYIALALLFICGFVGYFSSQLLFPKARDIPKEKTDYKVNPEKLLEEMSHPTTSAKYIDKVIELKGQLTGIAQNYVMLNNTIQVNLLETGMGSLSIGSDVVVKGRCVGYDDLLEEVKIDQAIIIEIE
ncbi:hypothetical protein ACOCEA_11880 [Maribacter sp. CXY002]|uniref:hypothetical protein n=1 Tax=Maribacter luteocoastalis TaxID=3407671 RepID=UPI003B67562D